MHQPDLAEAAKVIGQVYRRFRLRAELDAVDEADLRQECFLQVLLANRTYGREVPYNAFARRVVQNTMSNTILEASPVTAKHRRVVLKGHRRVPVPNADYSTEEEPGEGSLLHEIHQALARTGSEDTVDAHLARQEDARKVRERLEELYGDNGPLIFDLLSGETTPAEVAAQIGTHARMVHQWMNSSKEELWHDPVLREIIGFR